MVTHLVAKNGLVRRTAWLALMLGVMIFLVRATNAQDEVIGPERARQALKFAIDNYRNGEFEAAEQLFRAAQSGQQHLTSVQQRDLSGFSAKNVIALKSKREGGMQLQRAEHALQQGLAFEAANLLKALNANQYLTTMEKQQVEDLTRRLQAPVPGAPPGNTDAKSLLSAGRAALKQGDLAAAESLAVQAEKASSSLTTLMQPWSDSPAKLRRDILNARAKPALPPNVEVEVKESSWLPDIKGLFGKNDKPTGPPLDLTQSLDVPPVEPAKSTSKLIGGLWPFGTNSSSPKKDREQVLVEKIARHMLQDGYRALELNNFEVARKLAFEAKNAQVNWDPNGMTPDGLLHEIQRRQSSLANVMPNAGREPVKDADPRVLVRQGRALLGQKKFDEADLLCNQAQASKDARWGLFEDTPDKLRKEILRVRTASNRDESAKAMIQARKLFTQGNLDEAEKHAFLAQNLHGPFGVFDFGDRPSKLIEEIGRLRAAKNIDTPKSPTDPAQLAKAGKDGPNKIGPPPMIPPGVMNENKNRAMVIVREAREMERQGMFIEARQKALEARALNATFNLNEEDSPDAVLSSIYARCDKQIQAHLQQATEQVAKTDDSQRFEKAQACLVAARRIAQIFNLDAGRIDQTAHYLNQVAAGTQPFNGNSPVGPLKVDIASTGDPERDAWLKAGRQQLHHAQLELAHGNCASARKICLELWNQPAYGVAEEVKRLVRSISAEEYNQSLIEAKRNFEAAVEAFARKDHQKSLFLFQTIDPSLLPQQYQAQMRDIMATPDMHPSSMIQLVGNQSSGQEILKGGKITEKKTQTTLPNSERDNMLDDYKSLQLVQVQQLRQQGSEVMRRANDLFNQKDKEQKQKAIDALKQYVDQIGLAHLESARANELRRMPEARMQQYRNLMDQDRLTEREKGMRFASFHDENKHQKDIVKRQEQVVEKMRSVTELVKQNKLKEAMVLLEQVREIDPENVAALAARRIIETRRAQENWDRDEKKQQDFFVGQLAHHPSPSLTHENPIDYGNKPRGPRGNPSGGIPYQLKDPKEKAIEYRLRQPISLHLKDRPLEDAIRDISAISGIQVVPDLGTLQGARVKLDAPLSVSVEDIDMKFALNILLKPLKLSYVIEDQVLKITTDNETNGRIKRVTYPIADLVIAVENHPLPDALNVVKALERTMQQQQYAGYGGPSPYGMIPGQVVSSHGQGPGGYASDPSGYQMTQPKGANGKRSPDDMANLLMNLIRNAVRKNTWEEMGGQGNIQYFPLGMALVINQAQEVQEEVQQLLASLRKLQDLQVSVELRAVLVSETFFERIGVDFDMNLRTPTSNREPDMVNGTYVPAPFINRTADRLGGLISGMTNAGVLTPDLNIPIRNSSYNFTTPQFGGYQPEAGITLGLAFLSDIQVFMFLEAVQGDRRAHIMQAPKITVYNGQEATIGGFMSRPQVTGLIPTTLGNGTVVMMPNLSQIPFGLAMTVQPTVSPDRRFIRLNVSPQAAAGQQDPAAANVIAVPSPAPGQATFDGGASQPLFANNPLIVNIQPTQVSLTIANTTVNVPDGGTVLLGGFRFLAEERTEYGPPILSKIPYLSRLFRNVGWSRDGSTLVYLVTARVIMVEEEERLFMGELAPIPGR